MPQNKLSPTPYPEVNQVLALLLKGIQTSLGDYLTGLYVHGSLAAGDFTPGRSDIDFVAATRESIPDRLLPGLVEMHATLFASGLEWAQVLEGSYVPVQALRRYDPLNSDFPALRVDGSFDIDGHGPDWIIQCHVLRERGITMVGPDIKTLIDPIQPVELRQATAATVYDWWAPVLQDQTRLQTAEYRAYAVLTMCRGLYTFRHASVASKSEAARWAASGPAKAWAAMIQRALDWRHGMNFDAIPDTLQIIRFTLESISGKDNSAQM